VTHSLMMWFCSVISLYLSVSYKSLAVDSPMQLVSCLKLCKWIFSWLIWHLI